MRDVLVLYPKFSVGAALMAALLLVLLGLTLLRADATTIPNAAVMTNDSTSNTDCRADHWPYVATCVMNGRKIRVIKY